MEGQSWMLIQPMLDQMTNVIDDNPAIKDNNSSWIEVTKTSQPRISIKEPI